MSRRSLIFLAPVVLIGGAALLAAQERKAPADPTAERRLKLGLDGYSIAQKLHAHGESDSHQLPIWSLRILEAQRDLGGDAVGPAREHLARMKEYTKLAVARHEAARAPALDVVDAEFRVAEAEAILAKAQAR